MSNDTPVNVTRNPLTPALSPLGRGEGDGARLECSTFHSSFFIWNFKEEYE